VGYFSELSKNFKAYLYDIWAGIVSTKKGMVITWKYCFRPAITELYPYVAPKFRARYRGFHTFDWEACIGCWNCVKDCPVDCIEMETAGKGKQAKVLKYAIDYSKCIFCALCEDACPTDSAKPHFTKSIAMGHVCDLSGFSREEVYVDFVELAKSHRVSTVTCDLQRKQPPADYAKLPKINVIEDIVKEGRGRKPNPEAQAAAAAPPKPAAKGGAAAAAAAAAAKPEPVGAA